MTILFTQNQPDGSQLTIWQTGKVTIDHPNQTAQVNVMAYVNQIGLTNGVPASAWDVDITSMPNILTTGAAVGDIEIYLTTLPQFAGATIQQP